MLGKTASILFFTLLIMSMGASADVNHRSVHLGIMHPSGVDVVGYSVESQLTDNIYRFYNFGFPSIAALGLSYCENYSSYGLTGSLGVGIGSVLYGSVAYQFPLAKMQFLKVGIGLTTSIAYSGGHSVLSYEHRF